MNIDHRIRKVLDRVQEDEYLMSEALDISDVDAFYDFCKEIYYQDNEQDEEFIEFNEFYRTYDSLFEKYEQNPEISKKLSEEILEQTVGGKMNLDVRKKIENSLSALSISSKNKNVVAPIVFIAVSNRLPN